MENNKRRIIIRLLLTIICLWIIVHFHKATSMMNLVWMLGGLAGLMGILWDYNYQSNHPPKYGHTKEEK